MPLVRVHRIVLGAVFRDYFVTVPSYNANSTAITLELDPAFFTNVGEYAIIRTTGIISNTTAPVGTSSWISSHPQNYLVSAPVIGTRIIGGVTYNCILVTVSAS